MCPSDVWHGVQEDVQGHGDEDHDAGRGGRYPSRARAQPQRLDTEMMAEMAATKGRERERERERAARVSREERGASGGHRRAGGRGVRGQQSESEDDEEDEDGRYRYPKRVSGRRLICYSLKYLRTSSCARSGCAIIGKGLLL